MEIIMTTPLRQMLALVVDDDRAVRFVLRQILEKENCAVLEAADGAQGIATFEAAQPDIILLDCMMPVMDGFVACAKIRAMPGGDRVPILMITALTDEASVDKGYQAGVTDFITKPVRVEMLRRRVRNALRTKILEDDLIRGKKEWEATFDSVSDMILLTDVAGEIIRCNRAVVQRFGLAFNDVIGRNIETLLLSDSTPSAAPLFAQANQVQFSARGSWFEARVDPMHLEGGLYGRVYVVKDITDRKRAEEEVQRQRDFAFQIMNNMGQGLVVSDADWRFEYVNPAFAQMLGYAPEALIGKIVWEVVVSEEKRRAVMERHLQLPGDATGNYEVHLRRADGSEIFAMITAAPRRQSGRAMGFIAVVTDLTERKQAEEALRESQRRYRDLFDMSPVSLWEEDFSAIKTFLEELREEGVEDFRAYLESHPEAVIQGMKLVKVLGINETTLSLYKAGSAEELLNNLDCVFSIETLGIFREELISIAEGKTAFASEGINRTLEGEAIHISLNWSAMPGYEETLAKVVVSIVDLTERKQIQSKMMAAQKLADLGTLAAGVAHEINSPLQVITGLSESTLLRLDQALGDPDSLRQRLDTIKRNAWRCVEIVRALLTYSRSSTAQTAASDLNTAIRDSLLLIEHQLRSWSNITVVTDLADDLPPIVCDRNQITQVLINLLTNARDAMPNGGEVVIRTCYESETNRLCLLVSDNGTGIPDEVQARIFDPFYTTKPLGQGTGLGLSIVAGVVNAHQGTIEVQSRAGRGTTFRLRFPASETPAAKVLLNPEAFSSGRFDDSVSLMAEAARRAPAIVNLQEPA